MLYLLLPNKTLKWADLPATSTLKIAAENHADLSSLPWEPSERRVDDLLVRWALRHGVPCTTGLVLHAPNLTVLDHPDEIRKTHQAVQQSRERLTASPTVELVERLIPGLAEHGRQLDAEVDRSTTDAIRKADAEREEAMSAEPARMLIEHWVNLGGHLPDPL
jgi:hypothetical protein